MKITEAHDFQDLFPLVKKTFKAKFNLVLALEAGNASKHDIVIFLLTGF